MPNEHIFHLPFIADVLWLLPNGNKMFSNRYNDRTRPSLRHKHIDLQADRQHSSSFFVIP